MQLLRRILAAYRIYGDRRFLGQREARKNILGIPASSGQSPPRQIHCSPAVDQYHPFAGQLTRGQQLMNAHLHRPRRGRGFCGKGSGL